jgi:putative ABC transport system ATP-binding protein
MTAALNLENLRFRWPGDGFQLDIPRFTVAAGERLFLAGPSGSGKSTLLGLLAGTLRVQSGRLDIAGFPFHTLGQRRRDRVRADHVGVIFQQFNLLPFLSVMDNVRLPCRFSQRRRRQAEQRDGDVDAAATRLLDALRLPKALATRPAAQLSVGQQQRVAAARALIGAPELILADEPTSALDNDARADFLDLLLTECRAASSALLFVSHDRSLIPLFDRHVELASLTATEAA